MVGRLRNPYVPVDDASRWLRLRELAGAAGIFTPVEVKAYYVFGLVYDIGKSVDWLLKAQDAWPNTYFPALSVFASAIELLGRCLTGNASDQVNENLRVGFLYLAHPTGTPPQKFITDEEYQSTVVETKPGMRYTVADLVALRNYGAHGQATTNSLPHIDNELLENLRAPPFGAAIETYWTGLQKNDEYCTRMGQARVDPYANRAEPLNRVIHLAARGAMSQWVFNLDWRVGS